MNAKLYLQSFGWKEGEALKDGGLRKPILVRHKKDKKGLGTNDNETDVWWEKLFDSQLKNLEVDQDSSSLYSFKTNTDNVANDTRKAMSPLYRMFVKGKGLEGTIDNNVAQEPLVKAGSGNKNEVGGNNDFKGTRKDVEDKGKSSKKKKRSHEEDFEVSKKKKVRSKSEKRDKQKRKEIRSKEKEMRREKRDPKERLVKIKMCRSCNGT